MLSSDTEKYRKAKTLQSKNQRRNLKAYTVKKYENEVQRLQFRSQWLIAKSDGD